MPYKGMSGDVDKVWMRGVNEAWTGGVNEAWTGGVDKAWTRGVKGEGQEVTTSEDPVEGSFLFILKVRR